MTFDEARLMANVNDRAQRLFENGYRARWREAGKLEVRNGKGTVYAVDTGAQTCDCPFYRAHQGRHPCKHGLGWRRGDLGQYQRPLPAASEQLRFQRLGARRSWGLVQRILGVLAV